jgi:hypothetical protein
MKHATAATIESLSPMLTSIRALGVLKERKPGVFYRRSRAFLHFHEDGNAIYADARLDGDDFTRLPCSTRKDHVALVKAIRQSLE